MVANATRLGGKRDPGAFIGRYRHLIMIMLCSAAVGGLITRALMPAEPVAAGRVALVSRAPGTTSVLEGRFKPPAIKGKMEQLQRDASSPEDMWIETIHVESPRIFLVHNLISPSECQHLIKLAKSKGMVKALITPYGGTGLVESSTRTNTMAWLDFREDGVVASLEDKVAKITGTLPEQAENTQILHYEPGKKFTEHHDYFDPAMDPPENFAKGGNRRLTVITYLKAAEEGGGTHFFHPNITLFPKPGDAVMFYDMKDGCDGTNPECVDKSSEHAGLPPTVGDKWVATKWIHERQYQDAPPVPAGCYDRHPRCMEWMRREPSECTENPTWMRNHCARACGKCAPE